MAATQIQSEQTLDSHLQAFARGDIEAIMADYAEDAVFYTPDTVLRGKAQIRPLFTELLKNFPPGSDTEVKRRVVDGELVYIVWSGASPSMRIPFATDTFIIRDGKIVRQTFAAQVEPGADRSEQA